jgi:hypothetical protein
MMPLQKTTNYKIHLATANEAVADFTLNVRPTSDLIIEVLEAYRFEIPPFAKPKSAEAQKIEESQYKKAVERINNLITLVRMADIETPVTGGRANSYVIIAGVQVGLITIQAREAWAAA